MATIHFLFAQLQSRYPMSSLVTELVNFHENLFVVRACVQMSGTTIATGMAANSVLETAEDQARLRSLNVLGIGVNLDAEVESINGSSHLNVASPPLTNPAWLEAAPSVEAISPITGVNSMHQIEPGFSGSSASEVEEPLPLIEPSSAFSSDFEPNQNTFMNDDSFEVSNSFETSNSFEESYSFEDAYTPLEAPAPVEKAKPKSFTSAKPQKTTKPEKAIAPPADEPDDLSNLIALTDIEMDRVGWSKQQGRDYLKATYGKSTRQRLDIDELMDFLNYLRALPSTNGLT